MKRISLIILCLSAVFYACAQGNGNESRYVYVDNASDGYANVVLGPVPAELDFAGERIPLENFDTRESLQREMLVTYYMHSRTYLALLNMKRYFSIIEPILERNNIPDDFKYLCMAESSLDPNAVSSAGAAGLWQFMPATGKEYGMFQAKGVDERFDIEKSTEAACKYLRKVYDRFGSWTLAAAAYNLGSEGVARRKNTQQTDSYYDTFLPTETMRYVFRILTWKMVASDPQAYGYRISESDFYPALTDYHVIEVKGANIDWSQVAKDNGTTYKMLRQLNHWIRDYDFNNSTGRTFQLKIPNEGFRQYPCGN